MTEFKVGDRVRRIAPGDYGPVRVWNQEGVGMCISIPGRPYSPTELRSACMTLSQLAEALEDQK